ncbi:MAG: class I SAM-dependent methyltransferase [Nostoc sp.]
MRSEMIEKARQNYPHIRFDVVDARNFQVDKPLDAVFSNAVLHWVKEADSAIASSINP